MDRTKNAYEYLKNAILDGVIRQGEPLKEVELAQNLQMSRSPIREALRQLEIEGIVTSYPGRGTFVAVITPYDVEEIYELRTIFELFALEKSFPRITDADLDRAEQSFLERNEPFNWEKYHDADRAFHQMLVDKCGNRRAATFLSILNNQVEWVRRCSARNAARSSSARLAEHLHIIECIRKRDLEASKEALRTHLRNVSNAAMDTCRLMATEQRS